MLRLLCRRSQISEITTIVHAVESKKNKRKTYSQKRLSPELLEWIQTHTKFSSYSPAGGYSPTSSNRGQHCRRFFFNGETYCIEYTLSQSEELIQNLPPDRQISFYRRTSRKN